MFDTMKVARKIRTARTDLNMTQMELADVMEVSYQAVSNWERGNSMPDISKLTQLCSVLQISLDELLQNDTETSAIKKIIRKEAGEETEPVTLGELENVMPLLPPRQASTCIKEALQGQETLDLKAITGIAPFLDTEYLDSLLNRIETASFPEISSVAPFLSTQALDSLVEKADLDGNFSQILSLAPFLSTQALDSLVEKAGLDGNFSQIQGLVPFLSTQALDSLVEKAALDGNFSQIQGLVPFLSAQTLDSLVEKAALDGNFSQIQGLAPFLSAQTLDSLVEKHLLENPDGSIDIHSIHSLLPFLSGKTLHGLAETMMKHGNLEELKSILPFC